MRPGDIVGVDFGNPIGSEPGFVRPAIVVTAEAVLTRHPRTLHVVPMTSNISRAMPTEILVDDASFDRPSAAQCHLCTVISVERITDPPTKNVGPALLAQIRSVLADLLDLM